jgi:hypothetical protein
MNVEQIRMLAEMERKMDDGTAPFVRPAGSRERMAVMPVVMAELGLVSGQTVTDAIVIAILEAQVAALTAQIAVDKAARGSSKE